MSLLIIVMWRKKEKKRGLIRCIIVVSDEGMWVVVSNLVYFGFMQLYSE